MTSENQSKTMTLTETNEKPKYDTPYVCKDDSTIFFGKHKGKPHSILKEPENHKYCQWLLQTEEGFADSTKVYIQNNVKAFWSLERV